MACHEMGQMYNAMTHDMGRKLSGYAVSLQARYGDPRIYAAQREQMARDKAAVAHARSRKTEELLADAYERQQQRNRELHNTRISSRVGQRSSSRPESAGPGARRTPAPAAAAPVPSDQAPASSPD